MYVYMYVCMCIYIYICIILSPSLCVCIYIYTQIHISVKRDRLAWDVVGALLIFYDLIVIPMQAPFLAPPILCNII